MDDIFGWPPLLWTLRVSALIVAGGVSATIALYFSRFLRPKHLWRLLTAELPKFEKVGGSVTVLGQELAASATLDTAREREINALDRRVTILEEQVRDFGEFVGKALKSAQAGENGDDEPAAG